MAARRERGLFDPDAAPGDEPVRPPRSTRSAPTATSRRASATRRRSLAGHQKLGNLIVIYDDNEISIEDDTNDRASPRTSAARYEAYGWHVQTVDWRAAGRDYHEDVGRAGRRARRRPRRRPSRPSFIALRTIIGWPAPNKQNTGKVHGSALGADEVAATKKVLGFDPDEDASTSTPSVLAHAREVRRARPRPRTRSGRRAFDAWAAANPERAALFDRLSTRDAAGRLGPTALPSFPPDPKGIATRKASGDGAQRARAGAAGAVGRLGRPGREQQHHDRRASRRSSRPSTPTKEFPGDWYGRTLHFGIREHAHGRDPQRHRAARRHPRRTAARSWSSATTCARRSGWPR